LRSAERIREFISFTIGRGQKKKKNETPNSKLRGILEQPQLRFFVQLLLLFFHYLFTEILKTLSHIASIFPDKLLSGFHPLPRYILPSGILRDKYNDTETLTSKKFTFF
jgi:hypothetical protein